MLPLNQPSKTNKPIQKDRQKCSVINYHLLQMVCMKREINLDTRGCYFKKQSLTLAHPNCALNNLNPFTPMISEAILLTICHTVLKMLV